VKAVIQLLQATTGYYRLSQSVKAVIQLLQATTGYYRLSQSVKNITLRTIRTLLIDYNFGKINTRKYEGEKNEVRVKRGRESSGVGERKSEGERNEVGERKREGEEWGIFDCYS
jgi:hypothetical protein